jgi:hypothetical protein
VEEIKKIADQLEQESDTSRNLAHGVDDPTDEVRLACSTVEGLAKRFAQMTESLRKIAEELKIKAKPSLAPEVRSGLQGCGAAVNLYGNRQGG